MNDSVQRPRLRSLRNKLALLFSAITAFAFSGLYFYVVPQLESNLREKKLEDIARVAARAQPALGATTRDPNLTAPQLDRRVRALADAADARVTLLGVQQSLGAGGGGPFYVISDSREERAVPENRALAARVLRSGSPSSGDVFFRGEEVGQVAQPLTYNGEIARIALFSRDFDDVAETVAFVRNRLLVATAAALLLTLIGGYAVAGALARRVRRLEEAAVAVASGHHVEPLPVDSEDELGQLTRAFNEMQEQLRRVEIARREFVATASHELRTPIFSLAGFVELLRDEDPNEDEEREFLDEMASQIERLQKLAVDLLDLSRLDAGSVALDMEQVDLTEVARSVAGEFTPAIREHRTGLELELPEEGIGARCDRERLAQIVRILLDNALRHTPPGTTVSVSAEHNGGAALLRVVDEGPGLPPDTPVFDRFTTGDTAHGAGLGLAIARELAERMGGSLRAVNDGPGASFVLRLARSEL